MSMISSRINPLLSIFCPLNNGYLKLCDFGLAKFVENTNRTKPDLCSEGYAPPEILKGNKFRFKVDICSIGCICELCDLKKSFAQSTSQGRSLI